MSSRCPCGAALASPAARAHGICDYCRIDAKKRARRRRIRPDFVDVPIPGFEDWGLAPRRGDVV